MAKSRKLPSNIGRHYVLFHRALWFKKGEMTRWYAIIRTWQGNWNLIRYDEKPGCTGEYQTSINPYKQTKWFIQRRIWNITEWWYKHTNKEYKLCQGCGEGISKFRIRDPNWKQGNNRFNCCIGCVDFYDQRWSAMDIVGWDDKIPICTKGSRCIEVKGGITKYGTHGKPVVNEDGL